MDDEATQAAIHKTALETLCLLGQVPHACLVPLRKYSFGQLQGALYTQLLSKEEWPRDDVKEWMWEHFDNLFLARKTVFQSVEKTEMNQQQLANLFKDKLVSESPSGYELFDFLHTFESYLKTSVFQLLPKFNHDNLDSYMRYIVPEYFYEVCKTGFFDQFTPESLNEYISEAPNPESSPDSFYGVAETFADVLKMLKTNLCPSLLKRLQLLEHQQEPNPPTLFPRITTILEELIVKRTDLEVFQFLSREREPEKFRTWTRMIVRALRVPGYLEKQDSDYFDALNTHMRLVFAHELQLHITDSETALKFCDTLEVVDNHVSFKKKFPDTQRQRMYYFNMLGETRKKSKGLPQKKPYALEFDQMVKDYFGLKRSYSRI